jgi:hypothetical protein
MSISLTLRHGTPEQVDSLLCRVDPDQLDTVELIGALRNAFKRIQSLQYEVYELTEKVQCLATDISMMSCNDKH